MEATDFVRLLKNMHPDSEVWLDASPTGYTALRQRLLMCYPQVRVFTEELLPERFSPGLAGVSGATTNPRLVASTIIDDQEHWWPRIHALHRENDNAQIQQRLHAELIGQGAGLLKGLWHKSGHQQGWLSAQVNALDVHSTERMVQEGLLLARIAPNVLVKVPGSGAGYAAIERLVAQGCSINNTFCFSMSQVAAGIEAIRRGQVIALRNGRDLSASRYVITFMIGRWGGEALLDWQAEQQGIHLTPLDKRWAEIAIYQTIQAFMARQLSPARLLLSSIKVDQAADGSRQCWHLQKTGEHETRYTLTAEIIEFLVQREAEGKPLQPERDNAIPSTTMRKLMQLPYFRESCFEGAIAPADFARQPAFIRARHEACKAHRRLGDFIVSGLASKASDHLTHWSGRSAPVNPQARPGAAT
ncbi:transaldolase family protein [Pseudomonas sp. NA-150]|uniref:transaldolase family protein n=1 Tax=Pseudomonas sp. NA-150 TaxID=3367525 RepID=UPI0037C51BC4